MRNGVATALVAALLLGGAVPRASAQEPDAGTAAEAAVPAPPPAPRTIADLPEAERPAIAAWVEKKKVELGDPVRLHVTLRRRDAQSFHLPQSAAIGQAGLDLVDKGLESAPDGAGWTKDHYRFTLVALAPGRLAIGPLRFGGVLPGGEVAYAETQAIEVEVADPLAAAKGEPALRAERPVVKVFEKNYILLRALGVLAGLALLVWLVWFMASRWEKWHPKAPVAPPPPRPPEEVAWEKLGLLRGRLPLAPDAKKPWYFELSEVMREYLGNRFDFDAMESTSEEIIDRMKTIKTVGVTQAELWRHLSGCDMVKFAKRLPVEGEDAETVDEAFRIVKETTERGRAE